MFRPARRRKRMSNRTWKKCWRIRFDRTRYMYRSRRKTVEINDKGARILPRIILHWRVIGEGVCGCGLFEGNVCLFGLFARFV